MKKALVNYWVDMVTGIAFLLCAVTGIVFLFPGAVQTAIGATPTILLIPATWWHSVHDWTGIAMVAGTALHLALHAKWITVMTRKTFGSPAKAAPVRATRPTRVAGTALQPSAGAAPATAVAGSGGAPRVVAAAELERLERRWDDLRRENQRRHTRKAFLTGAAAVGGAALLVGLGLGGRDAVSALLERSTEQASASEAGGSSQATVDDSGYGSSAQDSSADAGSTGGSTASGSTGGATDSGATAAGSEATAAGSGGAARVAVAAGSCVGCGACLQVCPAGVFSFNGSTAVAQNPDACRLCGRCTQVCPAAAITLSA